MKKKTVSSDLPLSELTLRRYEKPSSLSERELIKKLCLSLGLLQPGDSRDVIVDVLSVLLDVRKKKKLLIEPAITKEVIKRRRKAHLPLKGIAHSNIRRQLKRLRDIFLVEKIKNEYRINEFESIDWIFDEKISKMLLPMIVSRVKEYTKLL